MKRNSTWLIIFLLNTGNIADVDMSNIDCFSDKNMHIFDYNLNENCPIAVIFATCITQTIGYQKTVSLSDDIDFSATVLTSEAFEP